MTNKVIMANLVLSGIYGDKKETKSSIVNSINNSNNEFRKNKNSEKKCFNSTNEDNYVYLGSTNNTVFNNMGVTLEENGSLLLIIGKTQDLFMGLITKYFKNGFKYNGYHIKEKNNALMKFKGIYVDSNGDLIGIKRIDEHVDENKETNNKLYKIKFNKIECDYNLNEDKLDDCSESIYIEYEEYIPKYTEEHCLSSMDNMVWQQEENILKLNRKDLNFTMRLEDGKVFVSNLPASLFADVVDARNNEHQLDLKLSENKKIKSIKPISNEIQVKISEGNRTKMFYMDSSFISSTENYMYKIKDLKDKPPLSFHSLVGENNYNNYHS